MRNSPLVRTALFRHFKRSEISLRWIPEQNQCFSYVSSFVRPRKVEAPAVYPTAGTANWPGRQYTNLPAIPQAAVPRWQDQFECAAQPLCGCAK